MEPSSSQSRPSHIVSLLDTDLLKITTQCAVFRYFPQVQVVYALENRTRQKQLSRAAFKWLETQIESKR
jgi:nicotinate phosphoribosyltransferase